MFLGKIFFVLMWANFTIIFLQSSWSFLAHILFGTHGNYFDLFWQLLKGRTNWECLTSSRCTCWLPKTICRCLFFLAHKARIPYMPLWFGKIACFRNSLNKWIQKIIGYREPCLDLQNKVEENVSQNKQSRGLPWGCQLAAEETEFKLQSAENATVKL